MSRKGRRSKRPPQRARREVSADQDALELAWGPRKPDSAGTWWRVSVPWRTIFEILLRLVAFLVTVWRRWQ